MARAKGTLSLTSNIEPGMAAPLDARDTVNNLAELTASGSFPYHYRGMKVVDKSTGKMYILNGDDPTVPENWKSGTGTELKFTYSPLEEKVNIRIIE